MDFIRPESGVYGYKETYERICKKLGATVIVEPYAIVLTKEPDCLDRLEEFPENPTAEDRTYREKLMLRIIPRAVYGKASIANVEEGLCDRFVDVKIEVDTTKIKAEQAAWIAETKMRLTNLETNHERDKLERAIAEPDSLHAFFAGCPRVPNISISAENIPV